MVLLTKQHLQFKFAPEDRVKPAMITPFGLYDLNKMPFGLTNTPVTFQRLIENCL